MGLFGVAVLLGVLGLTIAAVRVGREAAQDRLVGTTGTLPDEDPEGIIHELETITGMNDGHEFVGRRVALHVPVQSRIDDMAFWVGSADNRVLVVLPSSHGLDAEFDGEMVTISGTVDRVPTNDFSYEGDRPIYIRAEAVSKPFKVDTTAQAGTAP